MLKLVCGLGNPGKEYVRTRHNVGFMVVDGLAREREVKLQHSRGQARWGSAVWSRKRVVLAKPQTFMNRSGLAVAALARLQGVPPAEILIIHDDLDIPYGNIKIKWKGGSGGHKGIKSIIECLGTDEFLRLRVGIGRPQPEFEVVDFVLSPFTAQELSAWPEILETCSRAVDTIITAGWERAMNCFN